MKRSEKNIVVELLSTEIHRKGFDKSWDEIRVIYPANEYELVSAKETIEGKLILITLKKINP